jgi:tetrahydromethanopterin S-methyltransferase subunit H
LFKLEKEQKVYDISGVKVGGQPGENPTVLVPSIFYEKHKIVTDPDKGEFDKAKAETLIKKMEEFQAKMGSPFILDIVGRTAEALIKEIDFVADVTKAPFLIDGTHEKLRLPATKHAFEVGLKERAIYNSIDYAITPTEIQAMKELGVKASIVLAFNKKNPWPDGVIQTLKGTPEKKGLIDIANEAGVEKILVDTAVCDMATVGISAKAIQLVKAEYGLPAGCGPANAYTSWKRGKKGEFGPLAYPVCVGTAGVVTQMMGANFILMGPIELADAAVPASAMCDALVSYHARKLGIRANKEHPLYKIF